MVERLLMCCLVIQTPAELAETYPLRLSDTPAYLNFPGKTA